jgi:TolB-like protein
MNGAKIPMYRYLFATLALSACSPAPPPIHSNAVPVQTSLPAELERAGRSLARAGAGRTIAVMEFPNLEDQTNNLSRFLSESFTTELVRALAGTGRVVERRHANAVAEELLLATSKVTASQVNEFARLLGADAVVLGTYAVLDGAVSLNVRLVTVPDGRVLAAELVTAAGTDNLLALERAGTGGARLNPGLVPTSPAGAGPARDAPPTPNGRTQAKVFEARAGVLVMRLNACSASAGSVTCRFTVTSDDGDPTVDLVVAELYAPNAVHQGTSLVDADGNRYRPRDITFSNGTDDRVARALVVEGVPTPGQIRFDGVGALAQVALLEIVGSAVNGAGRSVDFSFRFRGIPVQGRVTN